MKLKDWFHARYNSLSSETARERLEGRKLKKHETLHKQLTNSLSSSHRNNTNRLQAIVSKEYIDLLP